MQLQIRKNRQGPESPDGPVAGDVDYHENDRIVDSLQQSLASIEFTTTGEILSANDNFLTVMGYSHDEVVGQHHRIFVDERLAADDDYVELWESLRRGEFQSGEFRRRTRSGEEVWIQATYNPLFDEQRNVYKIVKFASDITAQKAAQREIQNRTQAVVEFEPDGTIVTANHNFLQTTGFTLEQIEGQHHRIFMPQDQVDSEEYRQFWPSLANGEHHQGEFLHLDSRGEEVWLQGAYNPMYDQRGHVYRVVMGVANITAQVYAKHEADRVGRQIAQSVTEMSSAIDEIAMTVNRTASLAQAAENSAGDATTKVGELDTNSASIGQVIEVIQGFSAQTNLLALNATIEAARAGEAGKGFAVVASEVKELATQTSNAAGDINSSIEAIQAEISTAVDMIQEIAGSVTEVSGMTTTVAAAIEEQSSLMSGMRQSADQLLNLNT